MPKNNRGKSKKTIKLGSQVLDYTFVRNGLSKGLKLSIRSDGSLLVSAPPSISPKRADEFLRKEGEWIIKKRQQVLESMPRKLITPSDDYRQNKEKAGLAVKERLDFFRDFYGLRPKKIFIKNQRTRWGSCSSAGNLNFNYRLVYLPSHLVDYLVAHELCHLQEMNHSSKFWGLLAKSIPGYKQARKELRQISNKFF